MSATLSSFDAARRAGEPAGDWFTAEARDAVRAAIAAAGEAEVVFHGDLDGQGRVAVVRVAARGNLGAAPAVPDRATGSAVMIHNHPSGDLRPSDADLEVAALLSESGVGTMIVSNDVERVYVVVPPEPVATPVDPDVVEAHLAEGGPVARILGDAYEPRPGQVRMARQVGVALADDAIALLEAGTGTGKTFAYVVPAVLHAAGTGERVVLSTATLNLQAQLADQDVPRVQAALGDVAAGVRAVVVKGRSNYVSLRRAADAAGLDPTAFGSDEERAEVLELAAWAEQSAAGDVAELTAPPSPDAWEHVSSQADNCLGTRCPRYAACHYHASRREAAKAQLLIVNHHLLLADLAIKQETGYDRAAALPPFRRVVLDEAHHLEAIASDHFGAQVTARGLQHTLGRLRPARRAGRGLLAGLLRALLGVGGGPAAALARVCEAELAPLHQRARVAVTEAFGEAAQRLRRAAPGEGRELKLRLGPEHTPALAPLEEAQRALGQLAARLGAFVEEALSELPSDAERLRGLVLEARGVGRRLARATGSLAFLLREATPGEAVRWAELSRDRRGQDRVALRSAPLDVGPPLRRAVFEPLRTVVLSSATLTVGESFDYLERRLGLVGPPADRLLRERILSPFDYGRQALLGVPRGLPDPNQRGYDDAVADAVARLVTASRGRAFVLFTSYGALSRTHRALAPVLEARGLLPLRQGAAPRHELLRRFRRSPGAVLFGTSSFWEGVDVPGDGLVLVVIARLPFQVPTDPLQAARAEAVARAGGDPFRELQLPQTALRLKQGFGRLIRSGNDRGAVVVLDTRLITRSYGRVLIETLPPVRVEVAPLEALLDAARGYLT